PFHFCKIFEFYFSFRPTTELYLVFFFQAEDGIRDFHVTGVQTCALPILFAAALRLNIHRHRLPGGRGEQPVVRDSSVIERGGVRSEERRGGKERRSRGATEN